MEKVYRAREIDTKGLAGERDAGAEKVQTLREFPEPYLNIHTHRHLPDGWTRGGIIPPIGSYH